LQIERNESFNWPLVVLTTRHCDPAPTLNPKTQFNSVVDEPQPITKLPTWSAILQTFLLPPYTTSVTTYVG